MQPQSVQMRSRESSKGGEREEKGRKGSGKGGQPDGLVGLQFVRRLMRYSLEGKEEGTGARNQDARQVEDTRVRCGH